jgi:hypothetical protein
VADVLPGHGASGRHSRRAPEGASIPDALAAGLSDGEKDLIVAEETLAWELGRPFVPETLRDEYDRRTVRGIHLHRHALGMEELWPDDPVAGG